MGKGLHLEVRVAVEAVADFFIRPTAATTDRHHAAAGLLHPHFFRKEGAAGHVELFAAHGFAPVKGFQLFYLRDFSCFIRPVGPE